jgi:hypothetical protein
LQSRWRVLSDLSELLTFMTFDFSGCGTGARATK